MLTYTIQRLLILIPMLLVISFLIYLGLELTPGDAVSHMISPEMVTQVGPEQRECAKPTG
jgi:peptide/nickel transport system permease protein